MELHGGGVQAHSEGHGRGSCFSISLPLSARRAESVAPGPALAAADGRRRILVADDNADAADTLAMLLAHFGHEVRVAYEGCGAVSLARDFQPDVALLDIGMPELDGYAVARTLRQEPWADSLILIAASGWGDAKARALATEAGFDAHLTKPVDPDQLQQLVMDSVPQPPRAEAAPP